MSNGWLFVGPALALISLFMVYPIGYSLWLSTQVGRGRVLSFGGLANIERLFGDTMFINALSNTFIFLIVQVPIMLTLALLLASALNNPKLRFRGVFRTMVFLPCVTSLVAYSILFRSMFADDGIVNHALLFIGLIGTPISWMTDPLLGQGAGDHRADVALDRLQHDLLSVGDAEHRPLDLRGGEDRRRALLPTFRPA